MYGFGEKGSSGVAPGCIVEVDCGGGLSAEVGLVSWLRFGIRRGCNAQVW